jgi:hypothetical protein
MNGYTLESVVKQDSHAAPHFIGVFASDTLPRVIGSTPALLIVNTDPISKPGTHWQAIAINKDGCGEFFCSFGLPPYIPHIRKFMDRMCTSWRHNTLDLQAIDSTVCGQYCVLFLLFKAHGYSMNDYVRIFSDDCYENDVFVSTMFQRYSKNVHLCDDFVSKKSQTCCKRRK